MTAAGFIVTNSLAGLAGRLTLGNLPLGEFWPLLAAGVTGGWLGAYYGARKAQNPTLYQLLAIMLVITAAKLLLRLLRHKNRHHHLPVRTSGKTALRRHKN